MSQSKRHRGDRRAAVIARREKDRADKLQAFKDFVHDRLDTMEIPTHPDGEHSVHGCRIGDRLDLLEESAKYMDMVAILRRADHVSRNPTAAREYLTSQGIDPDQTLKVGMDRISEMLGKSKKAIGVMSSKHPPIIVDDPIDPNATPDMDGIKKWIARLDRVDPERQKTFSETVADAAIQMDKMQEVRAHIYGNPRDYAREYMQEPIPDPGWYKDLHDFTPVDLWALRLKMNNPLGVKPNQHQGEDLALDEFYGIRSIMDDLTFRIYSQVTRKKEQVLQYVCLHLYGFELDTTTADRITRVVDPERPRWSGYCLDGDQDKVVAEINDNNPRLSMDIDHQWTQSAGFTYLTPLGPIPGLNENE